jgi:hypothetical protein
MLFVLSPPFKFVAYLHSNSIVVHRVGVHLLSVPTSSGLNRCYSDEERYDIMVGEGGWKSLYSQFLSHQVSGHIETV